MAKDHYISQAYLKAWADTAINGRVNAVLKKSLKEIQPWTKDICRKEDNSSNPYLPDPRSIEKVLRKIEPALEPEFIRTSKEGIDKNARELISTFLSYLYIFTPTGARLHYAKALARAWIVLHKKQTGPVENRIIGYVKEIDAWMEASIFAQDGSISVPIKNDDLRIIQAIQVREFFRFETELRERSWRLVVNKTNEGFYTSDYPIVNLRGLDPENSGIFFPLNPNIGILITEIVYTKLRIKTPVLQDLVIENQRIVQLINMTTIASSEEIVIQKGYTDELAKRVAEVGDVRLAFWQKFDGKDYPHHVAPAGKEPIIDGYNIITGEPTKSLKKS